MNKDFKKWLKEDVIKYKYSHKDRFSKYSFQYWKEFYKYKKLKRRLFLVIMQLRNGKYDMFTITVRTNSFMHGEGLYYIDADLIREDLHSKLSVLFYHQDCSLPFKIDFNISELYKNIGDVQDTVVKALNPTSLKGFIESQVIEKVLKSQELISDLKAMKKLMLINLIMTVICCLMIARTQGWI